jgi:hypothetical protein
MRNHFRASVACYLEPLRASASLDHCHVSLSTGAKRFHKTQRKVIQTVQLIDFDDMRFRGAIGEDVTVTVEAENTVHIVTFTLNGDTVQLPEGEVISFTLQGFTLLQITFDFTDDDGGRYRVGLRTVEGEPDDECVYFVDGPPFAIRNFRFFVD